MPFQSLSSLFEKDKKLWLFGEKGLYYFDRQNKQGRTFTVEDGLPGNEFNVSAFVLKLIKNNEIKLVIKVICKLFFCFVFI